jgi:cobalamin biosynthesis Co2+ chelatase CbiK
MDNEAQKIADLAYEQARKVKTNALRNISHDKNNKLYPEYKKFAQEMRDKNYQAAKVTIIKLLPKMDQAINKLQ